ncbi:MAG: SDR family NAD(P)-dependent oxidoreductase [Pseudomonadales bacterium]
MKKVLVITGASKGIGLAAAEKFASSGYNVVNISRSPCPLAGVNNLAIDLLKPNWPAQWNTHLLAAVGQPEQLVLIHNAAVLAKDSTQSVTADALRSVLELNVVAAAQLNQLFLPLMKAGSAIVYVSSTLGTKAVANTCSYVISKHAVIGQMRSTCQDLVGSKIHTACVCPGFTDTEMLRAHLGPDPAIYTSIAEGIAHKRLIEPQEIAETLWFCSQNPVINGSVLHAHLGQIEN